MSASTSLPWHSLLAAMMAILTGVGCASSPSASRTSDPFGRAGFSTRRLADLDLSTARPTARKAFQSHFRIDPGASADDLWASRPTEIAGAGQPERIPDLLGGSARRHRQIAYLQISTEGSGVLVRCRVMNQRLDTAVRAAFARTRGHQGDDRPTETPIDRVGAGSTRTREEWVTVGRDREKEWLILDAMTRALEPPGG